MRVFVRSETFVGPDRRHLNDPLYRGPFRRDSDRDNSQSLNIDDLRWSA
jgi:hypothetical protein